MHIYGCRGGRGGGGPEPRHYYIIARRERPLAMPCTALLAPLAMLCHATPLALPPNR